MIGPLVAACGTSKADAGACRGRHPVPPAPSGCVVEAASCARRPGGCCRAWVSGAGRWAFPPSLSVVRGAQPAPRPGRHRRGTPPMMRRDLAVSMGARGGRIGASVGTRRRQSSGLADGSPRRAGLRDSTARSTAIAGVVELPAGDMASLSTSGDNLGPLGGVRTGPVAGVRPGPWRICARMKHRVKHSRVGIPQLGSGCASLSSDEVGPNTRRLMSPSSLMRLPTLMFPVRPRACWTTIDPRRMYPAFGRVAGQHRIRRVCWRAHPPRCSSIRPSMFRMSWLAGLRATGRPGLAKVSLVWRKDERALHLR